LRSFPSILKNSGYVVHTLPLLLHIYISLIPLLLLTATLMAHQGYMELVGYVDRVLYQQEETRFVILSVIRDARGSSPPIKVKGTLNTGVLFGAEWKWTFQGRWGQDTRNKTEVVFNFALAGVVPRPLSAQTLLITASKHSHELMGYFSSFLAANPEAQSSDDLTALLTANNKKLGVKQLLGMPYFLCLFRRLPLFNLEEIAQLSSTQLGELAAQSSRYPLQYGFRGDRMKFFVGGNEGGDEGDEALPKTLPEHLFVWLKPRSEEQFDANLPGFLDGIYGSRQALRLFHGVQLLEAEGHTAYVLQPQASLPLAPSVLKKVISKFSKAELANVPLMRAATAILREHGELVSAAPPPSPLLTSEYHKAVVNDLRIAIDKICANAATESRVTKTGSKRPALEEEEEEEEDEMEDGDTEETELAHENMHTYKYSEAEINGLFEDECIGSGGGGGGGGGEKEGKSVIEPSPDSFSFEPRKTEDRGVSTQQRAFFSPLIDASLRRTGLKLSSEQQEAVLSALCAPVSCIGGQAGTGKTTILQVLADVVGHDAFLATSITHKSVNVIRKKCGIRHAVIMDQILCCVWPKWLPDATFLVIEEASQVATEHAARLLKTLTTATQTHPIIPRISHLIIMGDVMQSPSIAAGDFLRDMRSLYPTTLLTKVFRTDSPSISKLCRAVLNRELAMFIPHEDVVIMDIPRANNDGRQADAEKVLSIIKEETGWKREEYDPGEIRILAAKHVTVDAMASAALAYQFNIVTGVASRSVVHVGERLIFTCNASDGRYFNGQEALLLRIEKRIHGAAEVTNLSSYDMRERPPITTELSLFLKHLEGDQKEFQLFLEDSVPTTLLIPANAHTITVSQGEEWNTVIVVLGYKCPVLTWRLLYTACTRAKKKIYLLIQRGAIATIKNDIVRCTAVVENLPSLKESDEKWSVAKIPRVEEEEEEEEEEGKEKEKEEKDNGVESVPNNGECDMEEEEYRIATKMISITELFGRTQNAV